MKTLFILLITVFFSNADNKFFGGTEEEKKEFQKEMIGNAMNGTITMFKNAGALIISPITDSIEEEEKKVIEKEKEKERQKAKEALKKQMML